VDIVSCPKCGRRHFATSPCSPKDRHLDPGAAEPQTSKREFRRVLWRIGVVFGVALIALSLALAFHAFGLASKAERAAVAATSTTSAPAAPPGYFTTAEYDQIQVGMTPDQVTVCLGNDPGVIGGRNPYGDSYTVHWTNPDGSYVVVEYLHGVVHKKVQQGLIR
jgi:hypothetical protein